MKIALAYRGTVMTELIQPDPADSGIYANALRPDGGVMLHHLGYLVDGERFGHLESEFASLGIATPVVHSSGGVSLIYADTRQDNGLFTEMVFPGEAGTRLFSAVPRSS